MNEIPLSSSQSKALLQIKTKVMAGFTVVKLLSIRVIRVIRGCCFSFQYMRQHTGYSRFGTFQFGGY